MSHAPTGRYPRRSRAGSIISMLPTGPALRVGRRGRGGHSGRRGLVGRGRRGVPASHRGREPADQRRGPARRRCSRRGPCRRHRPGKGSQPRPLHGVPFTIKDSRHGGSRRDRGHRRLGDRVPDRDATVVARLKAAGGILLGKTNTPEFTWANEADNLVYGRTSNPYDLDRSSGGSSGGSGRSWRPAVRHSTSAATPVTASASRRMSRLAGLKPTSGRVPRTGHHPSYRGILESFTQLGPIARRVEDLALILPIIAGPDGRTRTSRRSRSGIRRCGLRPTGRLVRGQRHRDAHARDEGHRRGGGGGTARCGSPGGGPDPSGPGTCRRTMGSDDRRGRPRLAPAPDRGGRDRRRRVLAPAERPGSASLAPLPGDELTALVEAVDDVRATCCAGWQGST